jgi:hypothetical protein
MSYNIEGRTIRISSFFTLALKYLLKTILSDFSRSQATAKLIQGKIWTGLNSTQEALEYRQKCSKGFVANIHAP